MAQTDQTCVSFAVAAACGIAAGCAQPVADGPIANSSGPPAARTASLHVIWPCLDSTIIGKGPGSHQWNIMIDGVPAGSVVYCSHRIVPAPQGSHAIRVADPDFDLAGVFGNKGEAFAIADRATLYVRVQFMGSSTVPRLMEIDKSRAEAEIKAIDSNR